MKLCISATTPEGEEMYLRHGTSIGEGPVVVFTSRKEAQEQVSFMKMGMEEGEDYDSIDIVPFSEVPKGER